jgi:hypothetical protein
VCHYENSPRPMQHPNHVYKELSPLIFFYLHFYFSKLGFTLLYITSDDQLMENWIDFLNWMEFRFNWIEFKFNRRETWCKLLSKVLKIAHGDSVDFFYKKRPKSKKNIFPFIFTWESTKHLPIWNYHELWNLKLLYLNWFLWIVVSKISIFFGWLIIHFSKINTPLICLTCKDQIFAWNQTMNPTFLSQL